MPATADAATYARLEVIFSACYALMMWTWIFAVMGFFIRHRRQPSPAWRYVSDSSYWLYLVHLPLILCLQAAFAQTGGHFLVRSTPIGGLLNGRRYPLVLSFGDRGGSAEGRRLA